MQTATPKDGRLVQFGLGETLAELDNVILLRDFFSAGTGHNHWFMR